MVVKTVSDPPVSPKASIPAIQDNFFLSLHLFLVLPDNFNCLSATETGWLHFRHAWWISKQSSKECRFFSHLHVPRRSLQPNLLSFSRDRTKTRRTKTSSTVTYEMKACPKNTSKDASPTFWNNALSLSSELSSKLHLELCRKKKRPDLAKVLYF